MRLPLVVGGSAAAWALLCLDRAGWVPAGLCSTYSQAPLWRVSPLELASHWLPMELAMMLPLALLPLAFLHDRSLARRRWRAEWAFLSAYLLLWLVAGGCLQVLVAVLRGYLATTGTALAVAVALLWQCSPVKQRSLNGCHRQPRLSAFGLAADRDAWGYGIAYGRYCIGACWALMLLPLMVEQGHLFGMAVCMLFALGERLETPAAPAWGWHGPGKALRLLWRLTGASARVRMARGI
ncbi:putative metal-binding integral membrane protein DUF2182 [Paludibacterium purpuratum]|uniref:Putative metal-binding integral membrane protein DUF2182 n=2 Tax=Paludibacterium purpuratum TaxID=1144873 RepID=A0A4R7BBB3_9NEIS|nr:putative metal-binding integral membrane protein DUF2182 [Paludibacterium purpuratum]